jgi:ribosomal protein L24
LVRDEVVILVGPDKGKTGRVLWVARVDGKAKRLGATRWGDGVGA